MSRTLIIIHFTSLQLSDFLKSQNSENFIQQGEEGKSASKAPN